MHDVDRPQLESHEDELDRFIGPGPRGQAGRSPAARFAAAIRRLGFLPTQHFVDRLNQRGATQGIRWDPRIFPSEFANAKHFRQTRPGHNTRIAVVRGVPIVYRVGGNQGNKVVLITALPPDDRLPPVVPARYPVQRELHEIEGYRIPGAVSPSSRRRLPPLTAQGLRAKAALDRMVAASRNLRAARNAHTAAYEAHRAETLRFIQGGLLWGDFDQGVTRARDEAQVRLNAALEEFRQARQLMEATRQAIRAAR